MTRTANTTAHKWLRKVIQEFGDIRELAVLTRIPKPNFYYWLNKKTQEGEDLINDLRYVELLQKYSRYKSLKRKLMPSSRYI